MTWLSRLLPQSPSLSLLTKPNNRTRQAQRRRRQATLEALEGRTLLSNVSVSVVAHELVIIGDTQNDSFTVTENNTTGAFTVVGVPAPAPPHTPPGQNPNLTQINKSAPGLAYTTTTAQDVTSIDILLPGTSANTDYVSISSTGAGAGFITGGITIIAPGAPTPLGTTPSVQGLDLNLTVSHITVSGGFSLYDAPTAGSSTTFLGNPPVPALPAGQAPNAPPGYFNPITGPTVGSLLPVTAPTKAYSNNLGGILNVSITNSTLSSVYIEQDGCCPASVVLDHDAISSYLTVEEGVSNGDYIQLTNSTAGATTLIQGYGPTMTDPNNALWTGAGDVITVQDDFKIVGGVEVGGILDLCIAQLGTGGSGRLAGPNNIPPAIAGGGQQILVGNVSPVEVGLFGFGIKAVQHDSPFPIPVTLGVVGTAVPVILPNVIHIESITVYGHSSSSLQNGPPSICTSQGDDSGDSTIIDSSTVWGNISAYQGNGANDSVLLAADVAGWTTPVAGGPALGGYLYGNYGCVTVHQGTAAVADQPSVLTGGDTVTLNSAGSEYEATNVFNNLVITQCDVTGNTNPNSILVDSTDVVTGNILIFQGNAGGQNNGPLSDPDVNGFGTTGDTVTISATTAGYVTSNGPTVCDHGGLLAIVQGNGYEDGITITPVGTEYTLQNQFNYVLIWQGESSPIPVGCVEPTGDWFFIDGTTINDDLLVFQNAYSGSQTGVAAATSMASAASAGTNAATSFLAPGATALPTSLGDDTLGLGNNIVAIATTPGLGEVYVGEATLVYQGGKDNSVYLGGSDFGGPYINAPADFETGTLDIFTGFGGGGYVSAQNTVELFGSYFGFPWVINGGGHGNVYFEPVVGSNTPDPLPTGPGY